MTRLRLKFPINIPAHLPQKAANCLDSYRALKSVCQIANLHPADQSLFTTFSVAVQIHAVQIHAMKIHAVQIYAVLILDIL